MEPGMVSHNEAAHGEGRTRRDAEPRENAIPGEESFQGVLDAALANAEWAWEALYRAHASALLGYLRSQNAPSPEDLLGEVFVSVVRDLHRFSGTAGAFRGWVFRIAQHRLIDARRAERRRPRIADLEPPDVTDTADGPGAALEARELVALLGMLPADQRAVLYLRYVADLSQNEIADVLGKRVGAVKMLQRRGQDRLAGDLSARRYLSDGSVA
jgi:RNA polymerase sigma-70 factor (ECF subfamily)